MGGESQDRDRLGALIAEAARRARINLVLQESGWGAAIALLGPAVVLAAGREWFGGALLGAFAAGGAGCAVWRFYRRRPTPYEVSQTLDARLDTKDQISTAVYFLDSSSLPAREQRQAAARLAGSAAAKQAFPVAAPRSLYALSAALAVVSALAALRLWLEKPLRLEQPLPRLIQQALNPHGPRQRPPEAAPKPEELLAKAQAATVSYDAPELLVEGEREPGKDPSSPAAATTDPEQSRKPGGPPGSDQGAPGDPLADPSVLNPEDMPIQSYEDLLERDAKNGLAKPDGKQGSNQDAASNSNRPGPDSEASGLLAKLREAMNNMLARMQQKTPPGGRQQAAEGAPSSAGEPQDGQGEGRNGAGQPQPGGRQGADGEGEESDSQDPNGAGSAAKNGSKGSEGGQRGSSADGAGKQEGDKTVLEAEQQEALGKLTELYGRRAQTVTGEVTVEAQPGKQTLRTPLSAKAGSHADPGGQVSRDEIPLAYQAYIKEYFSKIRQATDKK